MRHIHRAWFFAVGFAALSLVLLGALARISTASSPLTSGAQGTVQICTQLLDASLPYRVREATTLPGGLKATRCDISASPGDTFSRRTQYYTAPDKGWVSVTIAPKGSDVSLARASSTQQVSVGGATATLGVIPVANQSIAAMYWNDGEVAVIVNAVLSTDVTVARVIELAQSVRQR